MALELPVDGAAVTQLAKEGARGDKLDDAGAVVTEGLGAQRRHVPHGAADDDGRVEFAAAQGLGDFDI